MLQNYGTRKQSQEKEKRTETVWKIMFMEAAIHPTRLGETNGTKNMSLSKKVGFIYSKK